MREIFMKKSNLVAAVAVAFVLVIALAGAYLSSRPPVPPDYGSVLSPVMYFYSEDCHFCQLQKPILHELAAKGYRVKLMDVGAKPELWQEYELRGTPTFLAADGAMLVGLQEKEKLEAWLEQKGARIASAE